MILLLLFFACLNPFFAAAENNCANSPVKREIAFPPNYNFSYFIRVDTKAGIVFTSSDDCLLSLADLKCIDSKKGRTWEPYPVAGMNLFTVPHCDQDSSMCFYRTDTYENGEKTTPLYIDKEMKGYYQSIGFLSRSKQSAKIRIISYYNVFRDYSVDGLKITPDGPSKYYCKNKKFKLPMISKDAKIISFWDEQEKKTVLYKLNDDGSCSPQPIHSINSMVGKMDFDYSNQYAAYHEPVIQNGDPEDPQNNQQRIVLLDLKTKKEFRFSDSSTLYFPHFGENGLMYVLKYDSKKEKYTLLEMDPQMIITQNQSEACKDAPPTTSAQ